MSFFENLCSVKKFSFSVKKKYIEMYFSREHVRRIVTGNSRIKRNKKINEIHTYFFFNYKCNLFQVWQSRN